MKIQQFKYNYRGHEVWAPPGCQWIAVNKGGTIAGFISEPQIEEDMWMSTSSRGGLLGFADDFEDWRDSLEYVGDQHE